MQLIKKDESTEEIARKLKEYMAINKISQRLFAQSILGMKQANFSALLSQPLAWHTGTKTYKERYLMIHLWLNDPNRMEKLKPNSNSNSNQLKLPLGKKKNNLIKFQNFYFNF